MNDSYASARHLIEASERTEDLLSSLDLGLTEDDVALLSLDLDSMNQAMRRVRRRSERPNGETPLRGVA
ncbi:MAG: hypothetical protein AAGA81_13765 [Acidobacteriota bacterium]